MKTKKTLSLLIPAEIPIHLSIYIDTMWVYLKTPMQEINGDMKEAIGKTIHMKLTSSGVESDFSEAESIGYFLGPEKRNLGSEFMGFFTNLPGTPVKPQESWSYPDTLSEKEGSNILTLCSENNATLEGYETINGKECARIRISYTGTIVGEVSMQGINTKTTGVSGTDITWFAYKEGLLIKTLSAGTATTTTKTSGAREMTIPGTREYQKVIELVNQL
jgi:hypothetical protein